MMISKEEATKIVNKLNEQLGKYIYQGIKYPITIHEINLLEQYINTPSLDSDVEVSLNIMWEYRPQGRTNGKTRFGKAINTIRKSLSDKQAKIINYERLLVEVYAQAPQDEETRKLIDEFDTKQQNIKERIE